MTYYIKENTNSYCEINGEHTPDPTMVEVEKSEFDAKVAEVIQNRESMIDQIRQEKQQAFNALVESLVESTGLDQDQVRSALQ